MALTLSLFVLSLIYTLSHAQDQLIECIEIDACKKEIIECVPNQQCTVVCRGKSACLEAIILGGAAVNFNLICATEDACTKAVVGCGTGQCHIDCLADPGKVVCKELQPIINMATSFQCINDCPADVQSLTFTLSPTSFPTNPSLSPIHFPSITPTNIPTNTPITGSPTPPTTQSPSHTPTQTPSNNPTNTPTNIPTFSPTLEPTDFPSEQPTYAPTTPSPTVVVTKSPSKYPSNAPTLAPSTKHPTNKPITSKPTQYPSITPTQNPTLSPSIHPTINPTVHPSISPTDTPTVNPTVKPTDNPTPVPTPHPTPNPTKPPTTLHPTYTPTNIPSPNPSTHYPTAFPTNNPTHNPTPQPTFNPSTTTTILYMTTLHPSNDPTLEPTLPPTLSPISPTTEPTLQPIIQLQTTDKPRTSATTTSTTATATPTRRMNVLNTNATVIHLMDDISAHENVSILQKLGNVHILWYISMAALVILCCSLCVLLAFCLSVQREIKSISFDCDLERANSLELKRMVGVTGDYEHSFTNDSTLPSKNSNAASTNTKYKNSEEYFSANDELREGDDITTMGTKYYNKVYSTINDGQIEEHCDEEKQTIERIQLQPIVGKWSIYHTKIPSFSATECGSRHHTNTILKMSPPIVNDVVSPSMDHLGGDDNDVIMNDFETANEYNLYKSLSKIRGQSISIWSDCSQNENDENYENYENNLNVCETVHRMNSIEECIDKETEAESEILLNVPQAKIETGEDTNALICNIPQ